MTYRKLKVDPTLLTITVKDDETKTIKNKTKNKILKFFLKH